MEMNMEDNAQDSYKMKTEAEEEARNPFGYQIGGGVPVANCTLEPITQMHYV
jgi:hypothetical protein